MTRTGVSGDDFVPYPRTPHVEGSGLQPGDDPSRLGYDRMAEADERAGVTWVIEEKLDGGQAGISFSPDDLSLRLQSRGALLSGGPREFQFNALKEWARVHEAALLERLEDRYVMFGEWTFAMHTQFYDDLPHYFHEFDLWDRAGRRFLSTPERARILDGSPVTSVPVLASGPPPASLKAFRALADAPSLYRTPAWRRSLREAAIETRLRAPGRPPSEGDLEEAARVALARTGNHDRMEGVYVKRELGGEAIGRFKHVDPHFSQTLLESGDHWMSHKLIRQRTAPGVDIMAAPAAGPAP